ncbi:MAG TPA: hypothetical protein GX525_11535 [Bacilli bacterium]|nr:hypothetical protein [Bacilli bacterium]
MDEKLDELRALVAQNNNNLTALGKARLIELMRIYGEEAYINDDKNR